MQMPLSHLSFIFHGSSDGRMGLDRNFIASPALSECSAWGPNFHLARWSSLSLPLYILNQGCGQE